MNDHQGKASKEGLFMKENGLGQVVFPIEETRQPKLRLS